LLKQTVMSTCVLKAEGYQVTTAFLSYDETVFDTTFHVSTCT